MTAENGSNGAWRGDIEATILLLLLLRFVSAKQKAGRPREHKGSWF